MSGEVFIQWKGTDVCLDLHCVCGQVVHADGEFAYTVQCGECGRIYQMPGTWFGVPEVSADDPEFGTMPSVVAQ